MSDEFKFKPVNFDGQDGLEILKYSGGSEVIIPSVLEGKKVIGISEEAFAGSYSLKSAIIPDSVLYIGDGAFARCYSLKHVKIPISVTRIGAKAFSSCCSLVSCEFSGSKGQWEKVEVEKGNESLTKALAFGGIESLKIESGGRQIVLIPHAKFFLKSNEEIELVSIVNESTIRFLHGAGQLEDFQPSDYGKIFFDKIGLQKYKEAAEKAAEDARQARERETKKAERQKKEEEERQRKEELARQENEQRWWREAHFLDQKGRSDGLKASVPLERPKIDLLQDDEPDLDEIDLSSIDTSVVINKSTDTTKGKTVNYEAFDPKDLEPEQTFVVRITGTNYENRENAVSKLIKGQELFMVPDLHNIFDDHCIRVFTLGKEEVGFVSRDYNRGIFDQLRDGHHFKCFVDWVERAAKGYFLLMRVSRYSKSN
jgi:hypothetical protein